MRVSGKEIQFSLSLCLRRGCGGCSADQCSAIISCSAGYRSDIACRHMLQFAQPRPLPPQSGSAVKLTKSDNKGLLLY